jgi:UMF1 family MFS transporter
MKIMMTFLLAYWLYMDGVDTIVRMAVKVGSSMGFEPSDMIIALIMVQFIGFPAALVFNWFSSKVSPKNAILVAIFFYSIGTSLAYFMTSKIHFFMLAGMIGLFQGGIQAISRSLFARLVPKGKEGEFFGFFNMLGKFSAVMGPILLGSITLLTGSVRIALLSIVVLFVLGALMLYRVDFVEGEKLAKQMSV